MPRPLTQLSPQFLQKLLGVGVEQFDCDAVATRSAVVGFHPQPGLPQVPLRADLVIQRIVLLLPCGRRLSPSRTLTVPAPNTDGYAAAACQFPGILRGLIGDLSSARRSRVAKHPSGLNLRLRLASFLWNSLAHLRLHRLPRLRFLHHRGATPDAPVSHGVVRVSPDANATMDRSDFPSTRTACLRFRRAVPWCRRALHGSRTVPFQSSQRPHTEAAPALGFGHD